MDKEPGLDFEAAWEAVSRHDRRFDGKFVYAVTSTRVYCHPSCPSRRPSLKHVTFFASPTSAEEAGYRACRRCRPDSVDGSPIEQRIQQAREYLDEQFEATVTLNDLARKVGMSPYHLQRTFRRYVGVSPKQYIDSRRIEQFKEHLKRGDTVTTAMYDAGYGSSSRLYSDVRSELGMTPATYRRGGFGMRIGFTITDSPVGHLLIAATKLGVAAVMLGDDDKTLEASLRREYPKAMLIRDSNSLKGYADAIVRYLRGEEVKLSLPVDVNGTTFQRRVWQALQTIPAGSTQSYSEVARSIGHPRAARAVARACANNSVALVVPCHRVIRGDGGLGGYRWGLDRKERLITLEKALVEGKKVRPRSGRQ